MSAVHGPMPCTAVSAACASSAGSSPSAGERKLAVLDGAGDRLERADFGPGQAKPRQSRRPGAQDGRGLERIERGGEPSPDRIRARGRKLLRHDDGGKTGETIRRRRSGGRPASANSAMNRGSAFPQRRKRGVEIGFGMDMGVLRHVRSPRGLLCETRTASLADGLSGRHRSTSADHGSNRRCTRASFVSRQARTGICISATPIRRCSTTTWRARSAGGFSCASRISTLRAAGRNTRRRSTRISPGSASPGSSPVRRQSEHFDDYEAALGKLEAAGLVYPSFESRSEIGALVAERDRQGHWPRDPDGVPLYPGPRPQNAARRTRAPAARG